MDHAIEVPTGPKVISGSTRLKAGTAQKMLLGALSTAVMVRLGKTHGPFMVDMQASNVKLRDRAVRMVQRVTGCEAGRATEALEAAGWSTKSPWSWCSATTTPTGRASCSRRAATRCAEPWPGCGRDRRRGRLGHERRRHRRRGPRPGAARRGRAGPDPRLGDRAFDDALREEVLAAYPPGQVGMEQVCRLDTRLGQAFADAVAGLGAELAGGAPDLVASHGQTLFHDVVDGQVAGTLQLGQPAWIAERTVRPVVSDLRVADVAAGGQGAPLASRWDALWLGGRGHTCAALNLGGIANVTVVGPQEVLAFDTGPANALVDAVVARQTAGRARYDADGAGAAAGSVDEGLLAVLLADDYYRRERRGPPARSASTSGTSTTRWPRTVARSVTPTCSRRSPR
ncbi:hypothetical protein BJF82_14760 [Kytococcus sp. CUA-901]|nr:hypothetical protein BJF82_14760 [Kytococcus sp. CUA-901]